MKIKMIRLLLLILPLILASCSISGINSTRSIIDWVDFVVIGDIHYLRNYNVGNKLLEESIDAVIGKVKFNVSNNIKDINYKVKNGDAAFLPKGTKIYKIKGYKPEFRIIVNTAGEWRIYEADSNSGAKKGEDLLDISGKVLYISINSETDGMTELVAIKGKADIDKLVNMALIAKVNQSSQEQDGQRYFIAFHLLDGSNTTRCYWIDSGELSRGILLPNEFGIEIKKALSLEE